MGRSLPIRQPTTVELRQLQTWLEDKLNVRQLRRAAAILLYTTWKVKVARQEGRG